MVDFSEFRSFGPSAAIAEACLLRESVGAPMGELVNWVELDANNDIIVDANKAQAILDHLRSAYDDTNWPKVIQPLK